MGVSGPQEKGGHWFGVSGVGWQDKGGHWMGVSGAA
jgi:hypothetical protein